MTDERYVHFISRRIPTPKFAEGSFVISHDQALEGSFKLDRADLAKPAYQAGKLLEMLLWQYYNSIERQLRDLAAAAAEDVRLEVRNFDNRQVAYISTMGVVVAAIAIKFSPDFSQKT